MINMPIRCCIFKVSSVSLELITPTYFRNDRKTFCTLYYILVTLVTLVRLLDIIVIRSLGIAVSGVSYSIMTLIRILVFGEIILEIRNVVYKLCNINL